MTAAQNAYRIADLQSSERPRERLAMLGAEALSATELVALVLRSGTRGVSALDLSREVIDRAAGLPGLAALSFAELGRLKGMGPSKAASLLAAIELGRRLALAKVGDAPSIHSPEDAAAVLLPQMSSWRRERLCVLLLDVRYRLIRTAEIYRGSIDTTPVRPAEVFRPAIEADAVRVVLAHNHPSGDPCPSVDDIALTRILVEAGSLLSIEVVDHLVVAGGRYVSMRREELAFED